MTRPRLLAVLAHADDETLLAGALIAKYVADGYDVRLLCAVPGDDASEVRLASATVALGISDVTALRYEASPMWPQKRRGRRPPGLAATILMMVNGGPVEALTPQLWSAPAADLASRIAGRIDASRADVVLTHSPSGDYGHVDHVLVHRATVAAFDMAPRHGAALYCLAYPALLLRLNLLALRLSGHDVHRSGPEGSLDLATAIRNAPPATETVDVSRHLSARRRASTAYAPVIRAGPLPFRLLESAPLWAQRIVLGTVRLTKLRPVPEHKK